MILLQPTHSDSMCFIFFLFATDFLANQMSRSRSRRTLVLKLAAYNRLWRLLSHSATTVRQDHD